ncbi:cyclopropane/cyclopropene fatty acid synthesis protein [Ketogulonicigenium robustum]|uniref:Cyclopropane/cyclopropene fatty acid synthesis protein n=1 Tax=Ketogulonicigenium robustum TaxID=92947 RepID=A0A1W6NZV2_9RHOB|nr:cyclopropane/cyclopropene fatty acid synthesis protein [Ketogulonicigenium robustum]
MLHLPTDVGHARRGPLQHRFRYHVDYLLFAPEATLKRPRLFGRNRLNLFSFYDADHGGARGNGSGADWAWDQFAAAGLPKRAGLVMALLTQPRFLGYWFNPVSFWMVIEGDTLRAVIAEVNNTFGQRHSYICHRPAFAPIAARDQIAAQKVFHVSPFQDVRGAYFFNFSLHPDRLAIRIQQIDGENGLDAAMTGRFRPLTSRGIAAAAARRPGGALRVSVLIIWQALKLRLKGAAWRNLPPPPSNEISK